MMEDIFICKLLPNRSSGPLLPSLDCNMSIKTECFKEVKSRMKNRLYFLGYFVM